MAIIVSRPFKKNVIFHSHVRLPEGNLVVDQELGSACSGDYWIYGVYPLVIKHGMLENELLIRSYQ